jgi:phage terminase small subunit
MQDPSKPLKNSRHEAFARGLATGGAVVAAYEKAGYKPDRGHAARLAAIGIIRSRVEWLKEEAASVVVLSLQRKREILRRIAEDGKDGDAIRAIELDSKHTGEIKPDRVQLAVGGKITVRIGE